MAIRFLEGTSLQTLIEKEVDLFVCGDVMESFPLCRVFIDDDGTLMVDLCPPLNRKYAVPMPGDAIVSRNEVELSAGRYGVFISPHSPSGKFAVEVLAALARSRAAAKETGSSPAEGDTPAQ